MPKLQDIPLCPSVPIVQSLRREAREYEIRLITPLFGGGVESGKPDRTLPIRGTSIRGQLQFWWRATRGAVFATSEELFAQHGEVWGTTEKASKIKVDVCCLEFGDAVCCQEEVKDGDKSRFRWNKLFNGQNFDELRYALFPFQGKLDGKTQEPAHFIKDVSFKLHIEFPPELQQDVETAVWAWVNFGGIGARTRRGCGALLCQDLALKQIGDLESWLHSNVSFESNIIREWPTFPSSLFIGLEQGPPIRTWNTAIRLLRDFRQGKGIGRNSPKQGNHPGRSRYPEPETIREIPGSGADRKQSKHQRLHDIPADAFPRAEFGLPIVFHFKDGGRSEPQDVTLFPVDPDGKKRERMASPLILKPLALENGEAVPLIMRLNTPRLTNVDLRQGKNSLPLPSTTVIQDKRLAQYPNSPLVKAESGSALDAFLAFACEKGFKEVKR